MALGQERGQAHGPQRGLLGRLADRARKFFGLAPLAAPASAGVTLIEGVGWHEFERLVAEGFRHRGYAVSETGGGGGRAVDMVLTRGQDRFLVDCKPWRASAVGVAPVREMQGLLRAREVAGGFIVSSGVFTPEAQTLAQGHPIQLIDGTMLRDLLHSREEKTQPVVVRREGPFPDTTLPPASWRVRPQPCPLCGGTMVETERDGKVLLTCSHQPLCAGTREP
jgi:restriction system protein